VTALLSPFQKVNLPYISRRHGTLVSPDLAKLVRRHQLGPPWWAIRNFDKEFRREGRTARLESTERIIMRKCFRERQCVSVERR
jgi:hypothetical protein